MNGNVRATVVVTGVTLVLLGVLYPLLVTGVAQVVFHGRANGSLVERDGRVVGSALIGQQWKSEKYFHGRPSAVNYDAANSGGSNLGPTSKALAERVHAETTKLQAEDGPAPPLDLLTASGSGLDPDISPEAARYQIARVARARHLPPEKLEALVARHVEKRGLGFFGEARVNVLELNLDLDRLDGSPRPFPFR